MAVDSTAKAERSLPLQQIESSKHENDETPAIEGDDRRTTTTKPLAFYLGLLGLNINALVFSLDATSLAVALPVSFILP